MLGKAEKAIAKANTQVAQLKAEKQQLEHQLDSYKAATRTRKRVQVDPNKLFADAEAIKAAIEKAAAIEAQKSNTTPEKEAQRAAAAARSLQSMCTQWQI